MGGREQCKQQCAMSSGESTTSSHAVRRVGCEGSAVRRSSSLFAVGGYTRRGVQAFTRAHVSHRSLS